jgi:Circularly permuted ATP-grasp type 2/A predicted alpha-helical domain with a conserved ER motif.
VPGLVHAVRAGNVAIANALGSGWAETPALSAFLPGLCRHLLYEKLKMPSVATWWCGQEEPLEFVTEHLDGLVIKSVTPAFGEHPVFGARLSAKEKLDLMTKIRLTPHRYVAQEQVALSTAPVWSREGLHPRHTVVRVYAVPSGDGYKVMPGGLTRVTNSLDTLVVSVQRGGGSKDTWVLSDGQPHEFSLLRHSTQPLEVSRATFDLPSRMADNLFWLGRYMERVESAVRLARCLVPRLTQEAAEDSEGVDAVAEILVRGGYVRDGAEHLERDLVSMIFDSDKKYSIGWIVHEVRRVAWTHFDRCVARAESAGSGFLHAPAS